MAADFQKIADELIVGKLDEVEKLTKEALDGGVSADELLHKGLLAGMEVVGKRFKEGDMFIPEVLRCAKAMRAGMDVLRPQLVESGSKSAGTVLMATVEGDLHDIGKNLAGMMLEGSGFKVVNLGIDQKPQAIVEAVKEHKPQILGLSALLTTTMPKMGETIEALKEAGLRDDLKIMIGGAPVTEDFAEEIGADAYAANAGIGTEKAQELLQ